MENIGPILKARRGQRRQAEIADAAGIASCTLSLIETGERTPSLDVLVRLCDALGIPVEERGALLQRSEAA